MADGSPRPSTAGPDARPQGELAAEAEPSRTRNGGEASPLTGRCNCGAVRFEVDGPLVSASYCHCTRCQRRTGAGASANARPAPGAFRIVAGEDRMRKWAPDDGSEKWFCGDCGSSIFSRNPDNHDAVGIRMGLFDRDPGIRPGHHQFVAYAASWERIPDDGLPRYPERAG